MERQINGPEGSWRPFRLGTTLITLAQPHPGHELSYHRWYERDHFYSGVMAGPGAFAGARWAAPQRLKDLPGARPDGAFLATYWIEEGRHDEFSAWAMAALGELSAAGRMFAERDLLDTAFCSFEDWDSADPDDVSPEMALDRRYPGLVVTRGGRPPDLGEVPGLRLTFTPLGDGEPFHLCFVDADPAEVWGERFNGTGALWQAAFVPTVPGTLRPL